MTRGRKDRDSAKEYEVQKARCALHDDEDAQTFKDSTATIMAIQASLLLAAVFLTLTILAAPAPAPGASVSNDGNAYLDAALPPQIFHQMGQYSPRYTVPSKLPGDFLPPGWKVTLVNSLERHGARYMTSGSSKSSKATVDKIKAALSAPGVNQEKLSSSLRFLRNATVLDGVADLLPYGALQSYLSGRFTAQHYSDLAQHNGSVFIRTTGTPSSDRVIVTARYWSLGYSGKPFVPDALTDGPSTRQAANAAAQHPILVISEASGQNNTLDVSTCPADDAYGDRYGEDGAIAEYGDSTLLPTIGARLTKEFSKVNATINLTTTDILSLGNLCSFQTLGGANVTDGGHLDIKVSPYCSVFRNDEWDKYGYALDVGKYYGSGYGDPYHRGLATGYLRELLARLTSTQADLGTPSAINTTLDDSSSTFPIPANSTGANAGPRIFFDGSHDNNISPIAASFGLFSSSDALSTGANAESKRQGESRAWRFSQIAPLQGKVVWEKIECSSSSRRQQQEYVRVRANEAVQPAESAPWCPSGGAQRDMVRQGLCPLDAVVQSLSWVRDGSEWAKCFA